MAENMDPTPLPSTVPLFLPDLGISGQKASILEQ
jgi:hypothetical protein